MVLVRDELCGRAVRTKFAESARLHGKTSIRRVYAVVIPPVSLPKADNWTPVRTLPPLGGTVVGYGRRTIRTQLSSLTNPSKSRLPQADFSITRKGSKLLSHYKNGWFRDLVSSFLVTVQ